MTAGTSSGGRAAPALTSARVEHTRLDAVAASASGSRQFTRAHLADADGATMDTALLVVTELVTNAVLHGRGPIDLTIEVADEAVLVQVSDREPTPPQPRPLTTESTDGRGMALVRLVTADWDCVEHDDGKVVWALIPRPPARP